MGVWSSLAAGCPCPRRGVDQHACHRNHIAVSKRRGFVGGAHRRLRGRVRLGHDPQQRHRQPARLVRLDRGEGDPQGPASRCRSLRRPSRAGRLRAEHDLPAHRHPVPPPSTAPLPLPGYVNPTRRARPPTPQARHTALHPSACSAIAALAGLCRAAAVSCDGALPERTTPRQSGSCDATGSAITAGRVGAHDDAPCWTACDPSRCWGVDVLARAAQASPRPRSCGGSTSATRPMTPLKTPRALSGWVSRRLDLPVPRRTPLPRAAA